jgi:hypothetical protein
MTGAPAPQRRASFLAIAIIVVVALVIVAKPLFTNEIFVFRDHRAYFQPLRYFTMMQLRRATLPLWNPYNASGEPWLANPQTGVFYAPTWLFVALPFTLAYTLFIFLHLALLGCGAFVLFARRGSRDAALIGAIALMVCGPALSLLDITNNLTTFAWLPLVILCGVGRTSARTSAIVIAMSFLAGEPFFAAAGALIFAIIRYREWRTVLLTAIGAFALSAIQLVPFLEMLLGSDRTGTVSRDQFLRDSMPFIDWLRIIIPPHLDARGFDGHLGQHFIATVYCGALSVALAAIGVAIWRRRADVRAWLVLFFIALFVGAGEYFLPVRALLVHSPLVIFRYPARMVPLAALALAALAAIGWDLIATRITARWLPLLVVAVIAADGIVHALPLLRCETFNGHPSPVPAFVGRGAKFVRLPGSTWSDQRAWIDGYLNLYDVRFDALTVAPVATDRYMRRVESAIVEANIPELSRMGVGYFLTQRKLAPEFPVVFRSHVNVYRNPYAWPIAYWRGDDKSVQGATFLSIGTSFARMDVDAPSPGIAVMTQQDAPGWKVRVDGAEAEPVRVDALWRGVRVNRGHHVIEWRYDPASFRIGMIATLISLLAFAFSFRFVKQ